MVGSLAGSLACSLPIPFSKQSPPPSPSPSHGRGSWAASGPITRLAKLEHTPLSTQCGWSTDCLRWASGFTWTLNHRAPRGGVGSASKAKGATATIQPQWAKGDRPSLIRARLECTTIQPSSAQLSPSPSALHAPDRVIRPFDAHSQPARLPPYPWICIRASYHMHGPFLPPPWSRGVHLSDTHPTGLNESPSQVLVSRHGQKQPGPEPEPDPCVACR